MVTVPASEEYDSWTIQKAVELSIRNDKDVHIRSYDTRADYSENFYIGWLPKDKFINLVISGNIVYFKNSKGEQFGAAIFDKNPFEGYANIFFGVAAYKESILEISRFIVRQ